MDIRGIPILRVREKKSHYLVFMCWVICSIQADLRFVLEKPSEL